MAAETDVSLEKYFALGITQGDEVYVNEFSECSLDKCSAKNNSNHFLIF